MTSSTDLPAGPAEIGIALAAGGAVVALGIAWTRQAIELRSLRQRFEEFSRPSPPPPAGKPGRAPARLMNRLYPEHSRRAGFSGIPGGAALGVAALFTGLTLIMAVARGLGSQPSGAVPDPQLAELRGNLDSVSAAMRQLDDSVAALRQRGLLSPPAIPGSGGPSKKVGKRAESRLATTPTPAIAPAPAPPSLQP